MFFLVVAGAVTPGGAEGFSFPAGVVQPLFKTVIPRAHRSLQPLASTWLRDAGHNAWLCMINERHLKRLRRMVFLMCPPGCSTVVSHCYPILVCIGMFHCYCVRIHTYYFFEGRPPDAV